MTARATRKELPANKERSGADFLAQSKLKTGKETLLPDIPSMK
jgi:hypothetical protein